jgi:hypothetical protein
MTMLTTNLAAVVLLGLTSGVTLAQVPAGQSDKSSNNTPADTTSAIAPSLPSPSLTNDAMSRDYLRAARVALVAGHTGEAQQSLEMAETRALDRPVVLGQATTPNASLYIARIADARRALGKGDSRYAITLIDVALLH